jgi:hypothetical protein
VVSMMVNIHVRARVIKTLFVRAHMASKGGKKSGRRGSNEGPRVVASIEMKPIAVPDNLVRSEFIAEMMGREKERIEDTRSIEGSDADVLHTSPSRVILSDIASQDSSVSG